MIINEVIININKYINTINSYEGKLPIDHYFKDWQANWTFAEIFLHGGDLVQRRCVRSPPLLSEVKVGEEWHVFFGIFMV